MTQTVLLGDVCRYVNDKVLVDEILLNNYVSTENLIPDKGGLCIATKLPQSGKITHFKKGDVLVSNIRPYFKKIWFADRNGGASNDVLVFRPTVDSLYSEYLYYILASDNFFSYSSTSSGGSKMPRGDKTQIMKYPAVIPDFKTQKKIVSILSSLDEKIELNRKMNETLEQIGQALFRHYFIDNPKAEGWKDVLIANPNILEIIKPGIDRFNGEKYYIATANVSGNYYVNNFEKITFEKRPSRANMQPISGSIWFSKMIGEHKALIIDDGDLGVLNSCIFSTGFMGIMPKEKYKYYVWCYVNSPYFAIQKNTLATGAVMVALNNGSFSKINIKLPTNGTLDTFNYQIENLYKNISLLSRETQTLARIRDTLLPRLISGKLQI